MFFNPAIGMQGNIEKALEDSVHAKIEIPENREAVEQLITDQYLDSVQAQQDITDLMMDVEELKEGLT